MGHKASPTMMVHSLDGIGRELNSSGRVQSSVAHSVRWFAHVEIFICPFGAFGCCSRHRTSRSDGNSVRTTFVRWTFIRGMDLCWIVTLGFDCVHPKNKASFCALRPIFESIAGYSKFFS